MIQTVIALFIVAVALVWVLMRLFKKPKNNGGSCSCGCSSCPASKKATCPQSKKN